MRVDLSTSGDHLMCQFALDETAGKKSVRKWKSSGKKIERTKVFQFKSLIEKRSRTLI